MRLEAQTNVEMPAVRTSTCYAKRFPKLAIQAATSDIATWRFDFPVWLFDMTSVPSDVPSAKAPIARWEWLILGSLLVVAIILRFGFPGRLAIEHFDEGVYASNIWFGDRPEGTYPAQHLYAPPLLPTLIEMCFLVGGPSNVAAMWPSQLAGVVSVLLLWWLGRSWFGPVAGLVATALCATNEVLILLSRSALTDSLLGMWWLAALWALRRACDSGNALDRLLAGLLIGLAWFTKYNGWMPLGIVTGAVILRAVLCRGIWAQTRTALTSCLVAGAIAFAIWSPWLWSLQSKGGYSSVAANHRQYIVGVSGWWASAIRQNEQLAAMYGPVTKLGFGVTYLLLLVTLTVIRRSTESSAVSGQADAEPLAEGTPLAATVEAVPASCALLVCAFALIAPRFGLAVLGPVALVVWWGACDWWCSGESVDSWLRWELHLGHWILGVWLAGLLVATPLYTPYLRLTLPGLCAAFLGTGLALQQVWRLTCCVSSGHRLFGTLAGLTATQVVVVGTILLTAMKPPAVDPAASLLRALPNQAGFAAACMAITETVSKAERPANEPRPIVVYVYAEPSLLFELRLAGLENVAPVSSLQFARSQFSTPAAQIYLAVGIHALKDPRFREQFAAARGEFRQVGRWPWKIGPLVALDQPECDPKLLGHNPVESAAIELYEVLPP